MTPVSLITWTGEGLTPPTDPSPTSPFALLPQAHTVPSVRSARLWATPAATCTTPVSPGTWTGVPLAVRVPLPSSPHPL